MQPVVITTTTASDDEARTIAKALIEEGLAACVNIVGPVTSVYKWQGKVEEEAEYKLFIKAFMESWAAIREKIKALHSYSVPEITLINAEQMNPDYIAWMDTVCVKIDRT